MSLNCAHFAISCHCQLEFCCCVGVLSICRRTSSAFCKSGCLAMAAVPGPPNIICITNTYLTTVHVLLPLRRVLFLVLLVDTAVDTKPCLICRDLSSFRYRTRVFFHCFSSLYCCNAHAFCGTIGRSSLPPIVFPFGLSRGKTNALVVRELKQLIDVLENLFLVWRVSE